MSKVHDPVPWDTRGWREQCHAWILEQLVRHRVCLSGDIQPVHVRPWSTVLRVPTRSGDLYFKASAPSLKHEARLTQTLASWRPELLPEILGVEPDHCWLLLADGGSTLRSCLGSSEYLQFWRQVLALYGQFQIDLAKKQDQLLKLGAMDRRLTILPELFQKLLADQEALRLDQTGGMSSAQYQALVHLLPIFSEMCARLSRYGLPETVQHDDFHGNNIFVSNNGFKFFDWGETCVAHPFFTMTVTLRSIAYHMQIEENAPEILGLRDLYLASWKETTGSHNLEEAVQLAIKVGMVNRSLTWYQVVSKLPEPYRSQQADAVPGWLLEFLEAVANTQ